MNSLIERKISTPIGKLYLTADESFLYGVYFESQNLPKEKPSGSHKILDATEKQLSEYFQGQRKKFDLPLHFTGTPFQVSVWKQLQKISYGKAISYKELAESIKNPRACRAVGTANGKNPIAIIIPCHRVINENKKIGGYGGGLDIKEHLLTLEGIEFSR